MHSIDCSMAVTCVLPSFWYIYISIVSMHDDGGRQSLYPSDDDVPGDHDGVCSSIGDRSAGAEGYVNVQSSA